MHRRAGAAWMLLLGASIGPAATVTGQAGADREPLPVLRPGEVVAGVVADGDPVVETATLRVGYTDAPVVGRTFRIDVDGAGPFHIDLRSDLFDAYLVLRDGRGDVLAEDDDGLIGVHARIVADLDPGTAYLLDACALHGQRGAFELTMRSGVPAQLSPHERAQAGIDEARRAVEAVEAARGPEHLDVATSLNHLANLLRNVGDYTAARPLYERALAIREAALGPKHPDVALSLNNLAVLMRDMGDRATARPLQERALAIEEAAFGPEHLVIATSMNNLALLMGDMGDHAAARPLLERALAIREKALGPEHPDVASNLNNLAELLSDLGEYSAARALHERALEIWEAVLGPKHPYVALSLNNLAVLLSSLGDYSAARPLHERALAIRETSLGPDHPDVALSLDQLALLLSDMGDHSAALPLQERALVIRETVLGPKHPDVALSLNNLAALLSNLGEYSAARPLFERALAIRESALGPEHPDVAWSLHNLAALLSDMGDYSAARPLHERALAIREKALGTEHPDVARSLNYLALLLSDMGDHFAARRLHERALAIWETALGPEHPDVARSLDNLALLLSDMGDYSAARPLHERALVIRQTVLGPKHPDVATSLNNLANLLSDMGDHAAARALYERALGIWEAVQGTEHRHLATSLNNLAKLLSDMGDYSAARPLYERALENWEALLGPEHPDVASNLNNLANLLRDMGDYSAARPLHERALLIRETVLGPEHPDVALSLNNLAVLLRDMGDYSAARPLLERALAIWETSLGPEHPDVARSLDNLALLLSDTGDYSAARPLHERALAIREKVLGPEHPDVALSLNNLAALLSNLGDHSTARPLHERALAIREKVLGSEHPHVALSLSNLAKLLSDMGDHSAARPLHERALAIREKVLGPEHPDVALSLNNLAALLSIVGHRSSARPLHERALSIWETALGRQHPNVATSLNNLAMLLADDRAPGEAWDLLERAARARRAHLGTQLIGLTQAGMHDYLATLGWQLELRLSLAAHADRAGADTAAYESLLAWKGQVLRLVSRGRGALLAQMSDEARSLVDELQRVSGRLSALALQREADDWRRRTERMDALREQARDLETRLRRATADLPVDRPPRWDEVRASLPPRSALVDVFVHSVYEPARWDGDVLAQPGRWSEPRVSAWIMRDDRDDLVHVDLGSARAVEKAVKRPLEALGAGRGVSLAGPGNEGATDDALRALVWEPLAGHLEGVETVFVSPDGVLATLPFEVLKGADGRYLVEDRAFVYVTDAGAILRSRERGEGGPMDSLLALGGADYGRRDAADTAISAGPTTPRIDLVRAFTERWEPLDFARSEARAVVSLHAESFPGATGRRLLAGSEATEELLKQLMPSHGVVHLATHGFFAPEGVASMGVQARSELGAREFSMGGEAERLVDRHPGLLSGIVCAGANTAAPEGRDDGYLTAEEVGWLDLSGVELVVLSACETGLGRPQAGEGLLGLRRALLGAGARTVISSLWRVPDESTSRLMQSFYANLWREGMGRHEALRAAQLEMLRTNLAEHGHGRPSTWGAFVLDGDWR